MQSYTFVPGAVAANTPTALPVDAPRFRYVVSAVDQTEAAGGTASTTSPVQLTVVQSVPAGGLSAGEIYINPMTQQWQVGTATTAGTVLTLHGFVWGGMSQVA